MTDLFVLLGAGALAGVGFYSIWHEAWYMRQPVDQVGGI